MDAKIITTIDHFNAWGNAKEILEKIEMAGKMDQLDQYISELYPEGISGSDFNDLIGIDHDEVLQELGLYNEIYGGEDDVIPENESLLSKLDKTFSEALEESLNEGKQFYLGWRSNPQLSNGGYYKALGQLSKKEAKDWEKCAYGSMSLQAFDSEDEYNAAIEKAKDEGKSVR